MVDFSSRVALVLGGAACLNEDLQTAADLGVTESNAAIIATNHAGRDREGRVDVWVSFHAEHMKRWMVTRAEAGRSPAMILCSVDRPFHPPQIPDGLRLLPNWRGSSGLLAVTAALDLGFSSVILCGVPLTLAGAHYDDPRPWEDAGNYRAGWIEQLPVLKDRVKSLSGWTRDLLGAPDSAWLMESAGLG